MISLDLGTLSEMSQEISLNISPPIPPEILPLDTFKEISSEFVTGNCVGTEPTVMDRIVWSPTYNIQ